MGLAIGRVRLRPLKSARQAPWQDFHAGELGCEGYGTGTYNTRGFRHTGVQEGGREGAPHCCYGWGAERGGGYMYLSFLGPFRGLWLGWGFFAGGLGM